MALSGLFDWIKNLSATDVALTGLGAAAYQTQQSALEDFARQSQQTIGNLSQQAQQGLTFKPFTVTAATGARTATTPEGGTMMTLSPQEQALQQQLFGGAGQFYQQARAPIAQTEQDIFNRLYAVSSPERQREALALEERLAAQGRLGTSSAAYGGATPEQLALAQAQEEQLNQMSLMARQQALAEQQQAAGLGQGMLTSAYVPQSSLLNVMQTGMAPAQLQAQLQQQGALTGAELGMAGLGAQQAAMLGQANLTGNLLSSLAALAQARAAQEQSGEAKTNTLLDLYNQIFGGGA
jgi:hypothetical protein